MGIAHRLMVGLVSTGSRSTRTFITSLSRDGDPRGRRNADLDVQLQDGGPGEPGAADRRTLHAARTRTSADKA